MTLMLFIDTVRSYLSETEPVVSECRHCGTTVESGTEECPECGQAEIARYHIA